jgi:hypothetical protein
MHQDRARAGQRKRLRHEIILAADPPADKSLDEALAMAEKIAAMSRPAAAMAKSAINRAFETPLSEGLNVERDLFHATMARDAPLHTLRIRISNNLAASLRASAKQSIEPREKRWIASSQVLLAMTARYNSAISPRVFFARGVILILPFEVRAQGMPGA